MAGPSDDRDDRDEIPHEGKVQSFMSQNNVTGIGATSEGVAGPMNVGFGADGPPECFFAVNLGGAAGEGGGGLSNDNYHE